MYRELIPVSAEAQLGLEDIYYHIQLSMEGERTSEPTRATSF